MGESLSVYAIINAVVFGIVFIEILFQMACSLFNRQKEMDVLKLLCIVITLNFCSIRYGGHCYEDFCRSLQLLEIYLSLIVFSI